MKQLLLVFIGVFGLSLTPMMAQAGDAESIDGIAVFQGNMKINSSGRKFSYAFDKGDKVIVKFSTEKEKNLKHVKITDYSGVKSLLSKTNVANGNYEVNIDKEGVYTIDFTAKGMGARVVNIDIVRQSGSRKLYNTAWMKYNSYTPKEVTYTVDSMIGYKEPVVTKKDIKIFNKYYYKNVEFSNIDKQLLGQYGVHKSQAASYPIGIDKAKIPQGAKFKSYTYSVSSKLGGAKHWVIADAAVTAGALFLSPAGAFAAHGAMGLIGPEPGNEPVQYFLSNRGSDIDIVKQIYSPTNNVKKGTNKAKDTFGNIVGKVSSSAGNAIKDSKVREYNEGHLSYNQKGKVTNLFVASAKPPVAKYFIMANPERSQAKNTKLKMSAIYYAPTYRTVQADEMFYDANIQAIEKTKTDYSKTETYGTIKE